MKYIITEEQNENLIFSYLEEYLESGCVNVRRTSEWIIVDVESPTYFEQQGFEKNDGLKIKNFLRKNNFMSTGVGEYIRKR
jgi:hypothetical protein